jgi:hypothetical protein
VFLAESPRSNWALHQAWGPYAAKIFAMFSIPLEKRISLHESHGEWVGMLSPKTGKSSTFHLKSGGTQLGLDIRSG